MSWSVGTVYAKPWFWKKGNQVSTIGDLQTIKIGGNPYIDQNKKKKHRSDNRIKSTKYTLITFLPKNLLEQFRRIANFYFLVMTTIAIIIDSPVSPLTSLIPLIFVISVTAVKQGYEDFLRYRTDNMVNCSSVTVYRSGHEMDIQCQEIVQGDLVKASRDCDVPCDILLLKSSDNEGKCFITTANLDGETNLKTLFVPRGLPNVPIDKLDTIGTIECEQPRADLYAFNGRLELATSLNRDPIGHHSAVTESTAGRESSRALPLTADHLLLRGSRIKNTEWTIGCAVYTGQNTKLAMNSCITRSKISSSETYINKFLVFFLVILVSMVTVSYFMKRYNDLYFPGHHLYLGARIVTNSVSNFIQEYFSFLILYNNIIPISLYVTIELHKFLGSLFMEWDRDLYDIETNQCCVVNTSDLNEELGQVKLLFSDKTGTLTKNEMILQQCSINGKKYRIYDGGIQEHGKPNLIKLTNYREDVLNFFQALSVCHTVQVAGSDNMLLNQQQEEAAIEASFVIVDDDELSTCSKLGNGLIMHISCDSSEDNARHNEIQMGLFLSPTNNLNNPCNSNGANIAVGDSDATERTDDPNHKHTNSNIPRISFNVDNKIYPTYSRSISMEPVTSMPRPKSLAVMPMPATPSFGRKHLPKIASPLTLNYPVNFNEFNININADAPYKLTHRRTQSASVTATVPILKSPITSTAQHTSPGGRNSFFRSYTNINSREYYAAPAHNEASLLERNESIRRVSPPRDLSVVEQLDYQASSPDEKALVEGCAKVGFLFTGEAQSHLNIKLQYENIFNLSQTKGPNLRFERLHTLEFNSDRKRMSVIVKDRNGEIWLYTKGAESHVLPLCKLDQSPLISQTQVHINDYAHLGLRTLAVARRKLNYDEYADFYNGVMVASSAIVDRKALVEAVQEKIETNLELLGATAVEDALQDNVKDTLESLRYAGIMVWVLTGDKIETALNIAKSCGHIPDNALIYFITDCKEDYHIKQHLNILEEEMKKFPYKEFALLIDGSSLAITLRTQANEFRDLSIKCSAVLCCRLSPLQKYEVVQLMKTMPNRPITAAIGDGANDVSMIQEAHVGLGIVGKEGRQAARCADYAFANFAMVKKILLVHGHYYTQRLSLLVLYFFYKNIIFMLIQIYFQTNNMFSAESIYDSLFLTLYNVMYTSLPVLFLSLTEKVYPETRLLSTPSLYKMNAGNNRLTWKYFIGWISLAVYHSVIIYYFAYVIWENNNAILLTPHTVGLPCFGTFLVHNVVVLVNLRLWLIARYQSFVFILTILGSISAFVVSTIVYNNLNIHFVGQMFFVYNNLLTSLTFWLLTSLIIITALLPDYTIKSFKAFNIKLRPLFPGSKRMFEHAKQFRRRTSKINESTYL